MLLTVIDTLNPKEEKRVGGLAEEQKEKEGGTKISPTVEEEEEGLP